MKPAPVSTTPAIAATAISEKKIRRILASADAISNPGSSFSECRTQKNPPWRVFLQLDAA
jgi:hypothetical protein